MVVPLTVCARNERVGKDRLLDEVARYRVTDQRVRMAKLGPAECTRRLKVKEMEVVPGSSDPEIPQPPVLEPEQHLRELERLPDDRRVARPPVGEEGVTRDHAHRRPAESPVEARSVTVGHGIEHE
jgi:hypothetical protein